MSYQINFLYMKISLSYRLILTDFRFNMSTKRQENGKAYFHLTYKLPSKIGIRQWLKNPRNNMGCCYVILTIKTVFRKLTFKGICKG